ncbi:MAG: PIG-L family deacetylase [Solirubrobacterales bacterium]|nr:PIG-L family deacetylase [Solirubrobacterales bacterium]
MLGLTLGQAPLRVLAVGAHPDDIEIGAGGTLLTLIERGQVAELHWLVLSGRPPRADEARRSAEAMLAPVARHTIDIRDFTDGYFPYEGRAVKECFEEVAAGFEPDLVLTHHRHDLHQDHRVCCELAWNTWRNHLILEYEIPKYDGDMGRPNLYVPVQEQVCQSKVEHLMEHFASQRVKHWFKDDLFRGLMRLRGMECNSATSFAEAFYSPKAMIA